MKTLLPSFETDRGLSLGFRWLAEPCADSALVVDANSGFGKMTSKLGAYFRRTATKRDSICGTDSLINLIILRYVEDNGVRFPSGVCSNEEELGNTSGNRGFLDERSS